jgi:hypothetical protein
MSRRKKYFDMYPLEEITIPDLDEAKKDLEDVPPMAYMRGFQKLALLLSKYHGG